MCPLETTKHSSYKRAVNFITDWYFRLLALSVLSGILLTSYFQYPFTEGVSYKLDDAGTVCQPKSEGIDPHCFSDFYLPMNLSNMDSPWSNSNVPYPPLGLAIFKPFAYLHNAFPGHLSLVSYLLFSFFVMAGSVLYISRKLNLTSRTTSFIFLFLFLSAPVITILDRGNNTFLVLPALFYMALNLEESKRKHFIISGIFIVLIKPQFVLLGIFFLILKEWRNLFAWLCATFVGMSISFILYPINILSNFLHWAYHLLLFQQYTAFGEKYPINVSFNNVIEIYLKFFGLEIRRELISVAVVSLLMISIWAIRRSANLRSQYELFILVMVIPVLFVGTAFHYYLFVLLIPMSVLIAQASGEVPLKKFDISNLISSRTRAVLMVVTTTSCLLPWSLSSSLLMATESNQGQNISLTWEVARIALAATFTFLVFVPMKSGHEAID